MKQYGNGNIWRTCCEAFDLLALGAVCFFFHLSSPYLVEGVGKGWVGGMMRIKSDKGGMKVEVEVEVRGSEQCVVVVLLKTFAGCCQQSALCTWWIISRCSNSGPNAKHFSIPGGTQKWIHV
eukprot:TRINITY_DN898_c0_g1_i17.p1 TRINITY_DN898_c0_g1~~TRINITY_DN898_c0_g1_i17.p1  ORF type:complete len:122 (-),score=14.85 TRINITY_DN898_c0_g1_i17:673-1038(-)